MTDAERQETITALQKDFQELDSNDAYQNNVDLAQQRGRDFEKLVRAVFKAWEMLARGSYHTGDNKSEQIDGVLRFENRLALLEVKWEKANLAASELFAFLGKVEGKFTGTIGVFVSRNELTPNFLTALRAGRRQSIIVIHGRDVDHLFDPTFDLAGYLSSHLQHVCMDNLCHLSTETFLLRLKTMQAKKKPATASKNAVDTKINDCLEDAAARNIVNEFVDDLSPDERIEAVQRLLNDYADIVSSKGGDEAWRGKNLDEFLKELVKRLPEELTAADSTFFVEKLSRDFQSPQYRSMTEYFVQRYVYLPAAEKKRCEERLLRQWEKVIGDWMSENRMAEPTGHLWDVLGEDTKTQIVPFFVEFVLSSRGPHHPQHQLAARVLRMEESLPAARKALRRHAKEAAKSWLEEGYTDEQGLAKTVKSVTATMRDMKRYIPDFESQIKAAVKKAAEMVAGED